VGFTSVSIHATSGVPSKKTTLKPPTITPDIETRLTRVRSLLRDHRFSLAIMELNSLVLKTKTLQQQSIESMLPGNTDGFSFASQPIDDLDTQGTIFSRRYTAKDGTMFEVTVSASDPAIEEYAQLIKSPATVSTMENTKIIDLGQNISALERFSEADHLYERHILIGITIIINVTAMDFSSRGTLDRFCDLIQYARIRAELEQ
jgi:hypothetical protein